MFEVIWGGGSTFQRCCRWLRNSVFEPFLNVCALLVCPTNLEMLLTGTFRLSSYGVRVYSLSLLEWYDCASD